MGTEVNLTDIKHSSCSVTNCKLSVTTDFNELIPFTEPLATPGFEGGWDKKVKQ